MRVICVGAGPAGLYFSILTKLRDPASDVAVFERNPEGTTFGWGVTFSDDVLDSLYGGDPVTASQIQHGAASWENNRVLLADRQPAHLGGYGFAIDRHRLLRLLAHRASELGVELHYDSVVDPARIADEFADADLVLATDGVNSQLRSRFGDEFGTTVEHDRNRYIWLGTSKVFAEFTYAFERTPAGWIWFYAYPCSESTSTFIAECAPATWHALGFADLGPDASKAALERIFERHLDGHPLLLQHNGSKSPWVTFSWVTNQTWHYDNIVLMGDAAHTAHFSIGNGTSLAIDDAISLDRHLCVHDVEAAVEGYERDRLAATGARQAIARRSADWFEHVDSYTELDPVRLSYALRNRGHASPAVTSGMPWMLHRATQFTTGRQARRAVTTVRRRRRERMREPFLVG